MNITVEKRIKRLSGEETLVICSLDRPHADIARAEELFSMIDKEVERWLSGRLLSYAASIYEREASPERRHRFTKLRYSLTCRASSEGDGGKIEYTAELSRGGAVISSKRTVYHIDGEGRLIRPARKRRGIAELFRRRDRASRA